MLQRGLLAACFFTIAAAKSVTVRQADIANVVSYPISIISDQDEASYDDDRNLWVSTMTTGLFTYNKTDMTAGIIWGASKNFTSKGNFGGRGMELSDLKFFNGKLLSPDDKTGIMYWLDGDKAVPWAAMADGNGTVPLPYKCEWLTIKDNMLFGGGYGKEMTTTNGTFRNRDPMYIKVFNPEGALTHNYWNEKFLALRASVEIKFPGYMIHESAQWSDIHQKWFFLPRHMSKLTYNVDTAYAAGANILLSTSDCFCDIAHVDIGLANTTKGFSAFQFVPGTNDTIIVALKSQEIPDEPLASFIMVFSIHGIIIVPETRIPGVFKYEGIEFYDPESQEIFLDEVNSVSSLSVVGLVLAYVLARV